MSNSRNRLPARLVRKLGSNMHSTLKFMNKDIIFSSRLKELANEEQKKLISYFENKIEENKDKIQLYQRDFTHGTLRITEPGYYILKEHIVLKRFQQLQG